MEADTNGNVYITEIAGHVVRKVNSLGMISTVAGTGTAGFLGDGGPATSARLNGPRRVRHRAQRRRRHRRLRETAGAQDRGIDPRRADADRYLSGVARQRQHRAGDRHRRVGVNRNPLLELELYDIGGLSTAADLGSTGIAVSVADDSDELLGDRHERGRHLDVLVHLGHLRRGQENPPGPVVFAPTSPGSGSLAVVVVHRRRRRDTRVPPGPRRHHDFELGHLRAALALT